MLSLRLRPRENGVQYVDPGWSGTGSAPASGSASSVTFTVNTPSNITWIWTTQYYLTVSSSYGTVGGAGWYNAGSSAHATITPTTITGIAGTQYTFTGWSGDASGSSSSSNAIIMDGPKTATAEWFATSTPSTPTPTPYNTHVPVVTPSPTVSPSPTPTTTDSSSPTPSDDSPSAELYLLFGSCNIAGSCNCWHYRISECKEKKALKKTKIRLTSWFYSECINLPYVF